MHEKLTKSSLFFSILEVCSGFLDSPTQGGLLILSLLLLSLSAFSLEVIEPIDAGFLAHSTCSIWAQKPDEEPKFICSGTRIDSHAVLTAAHCLSHPESTKKKFFVKCSGDDFLIEGKSTHPHPKFKFGAKAADIGILIIDSNNSMASMSQVYSRTEVDEILNQTREFHSFSVEREDQGVAGRFGESRMTKRYLFKNGDEPQIRCMILGYGLNGENAYGHLQSQGLKLPHILDLDTDYQFFPFNTAEHRVLVRPGDSGGPVLCQLSGEQETFVLGVHSHSMEERGFSYTTPAFKYLDWIESVLKASRN